MGILFSKRAFIGRDTLLHPSISRCYSWVGRSKQGGMNPITNNGGVATRRQGGARTLPHQVVERAREKMWEKKGQIKEDTRTISHTLPNNQYPCTIAFYFRSKINAPPPTFPAPLNGWTQTPLTTNSLPTRTERYKAMCNMPFLFSIIYRFIVLAYYDTYIIFCRHSRNFLKFWKIIDKCGICACFRNHLV